LVRQRAHAESLRSRGLLAPTRSSCASRGAPGAHAELLAPTRSPRYIILLPAS